MKDVLDEAPPNDPAAERAVLAENVPARLRALNRWVIWQFEKCEGGRRTKVPYQAHRPNMHASSTDAATWCSFSDAVKACRDHHFAGIGFVFATGDGLAGIDLDDCLTADGAIKPWAQAILDAFAGRAYIEVSPSGRGLKLWIEAAPPTTEQTGTRRAIEDGQVETYWSARFFTVTGNVWPTSTGIGDATPTLLELWNRIHPNGKPKPEPTVAAAPSRNGHAHGDDEILSVIAGCDKMAERFIALMQGSTEGFGSPSEADYKLAKMLAWVTDDAGQIERIMRTSQLAREKWERADYLRRTIGRALENTTKRYEWNRKAVFHLTDVGNGKRLIAKHGRDLRYCWQWNAWLVWDGARWAPDEGGRVHGMAKEAMLDIYNEIRTASDEFREKLAKHAAASEKAPRVHAAVDMARSEKGVPVSPDDLDTDPWILVCSNGVVDLRTGKLMPHDRGRLVTKIAPHEYNPNATCPIWQRVLNRVFNENTYMVEFYQRLMGYCLTGSVREQVLPVFWGSGDNGKSTIMTATTEVLGDYAMWAEAELLMVQKNRANPSERMDLFGKRLAVVTEAEAGCRLAEAFVKRITGGEPIRGRKLYENNWEFKPTHKVILVTNHKPRIAGTDYAIWRRIRLVPFTVKIPPDERDPDMPSKLRDEYPGILAWMVRGCVEWQARGLAEPDEVLVATKSYRAEEDRVQAFVDDCCELDHMAKVTGKALYAAYVKHADAMKEHPVLYTTFRQTMEERGFPKIKGKHGIEFVGLRLRCDPNEGDILR